MVLKLSRLKIGSSGVFRSFSETFTLVKWRSSFCVNTSFYYFLFNQKISISEDKSKWQGNFCTKPNQPTYWLLGVSQSQEIFTFQVLEKLRKVRLVFIIFTFFMTWNLVLCGRKKIIPGFHNWRTTKNRSQPFWQQYISYPI